MALRELLAAVLSIGLGVFFIAFPEAIIQIHTAGRYPNGRHGEYGTDGDSSRKWQLVVRGVGVLAIVVGLWIAAQQYVL